MLDPQRKWVKFLWGANLRDLSYEGVVVLNINHILKCSLIIRGFTENTCEPIGETTCTYACLMNVVRRERSSSQIQNCVLLWRLCCTRLNMPVS